MQLSVDGVQFRLTDVGSGQVILLLHGFPDSAKLWKDQVCFAGHDMMCLCLAHILYTNHMQPVPSSLVWPMRLQKARLVQKNLQKARSLMASWLKVSTGFVSLYAILFICPVTHSSVYSRIWVLSAQVLWQLEP